MAMQAGTAGEGHPRALIGRRLSEAPTPALVLDLSRLRRNAARAQERARELGVALRPHLKTKSVEAALILTGGSRDAPVCVSTLREARDFFAAGWRDILYAVGVAPAKLPVAADLRRRGCALKLLVDSVEMAERVGAFARAEGVALEACIEIDPDGTRAGVDPNDGARLAAVAAALGGSVALAGVVAHAGGSYGGRGPEAFAAAAAAEVAAASGAATALRAAGHAAPMVSVGSTPTVFFARERGLVTEVRCGVYSLFDLYQSGIGVCAEDDIALSVLASVISRNERAGRVFVDAGFLAMSRDRSTAALRRRWATSSSPAPTRSMAGSPRSGAAPIRCGSSSATSCG
jgi:D-serine deaminase-like pyridoxal phosphate-dependent protein